MQNRGHHSRRNDRPVAWRGEAGAGSALARPSHRSSAKRVRRPRSPHRRPSSGRQRPTSRLRPFKTLHRWDLTPREAAELQRRLAPQVQLGGAPRRVRAVAGADVAYDKHGDWMVAAIVVLDMRTLELLDRSHATSRCRFPYVPGLLSFRECPSLLEAAAGLRERPDLLIADAQGLAHPRRFGLACHLGLLLDLSTIGCAKSRLVGEYEEPGRERGQWTRLVYEGGCVGAVVRTRSGVKPVFVSPGHKMTVRRAVRLVLATAVRTRLPEPVRQAHLLVNRLRRELGKAEASP